MSIVAKMHAKPDVPKKKAPAKKAPSKKTGPPPAMTEDGMVEAIDRILESKKTYFKQSGTFAPSSKNQCPRFHYYRLEGYMHEDNISGRLQRIFDQGNDLEENLIDAYKKLGVYIDSNIPVSLDYPPIKGYIDVLIDWGGPKVIECKSINEAGFMKVKALKTPKEEHHRQIQLYFASTEYTEGYIVYINKNNNDILPLYIKKDDEFIEKTLKKYDIIYSAWKDKKIPARPYKGKSSKTCQGCYAKNHCWDNDDREGTPVKL